MTANHWDQLLKDLSNRFSILELEREDGDPERIHEINILQAELNRIIVYCQQVKLGFIKPLPSPEKIDEPKADWIFRDEQGQMR